MKRDRSACWRALALLGAFVTLAAACGSDSSNSREQSSNTTSADGAITTEAGASPDTTVSGGRGELVDLQNFSSGEPDHIDPGLAGVIQGAQISRLVYDGLYEFDFSDRENPELVPVVAAELPEVSADGLTYTFKVRDDYLWSDGEPVKPSDFEFAWNRAADDVFASEINYHFLPIVGAEDVIGGSADTMTGVVADDAAGTLTVTLNEAFADFPAVVTHTVFSPMPKHLMGGLADQTQWEQGVMVGNGPFMMDGPWEHEQRITLVANPDYSGDVKPKLDRIEFVISKDLDSAYAAFEAGDGDTATIPSGRFDEATGKYAGAVDSVLGIYHFFINQEGPLGGEANAKLREAISYAIDRDSINDAVFDNSRVLSTGMTPPGVAGYTGGLCNRCSFDPDRAKTLVEEWKSAGGSLDGPITIQFNTGSGHEDVVSIIQQNLIDAGLDAEQDGRDPTTYFKSMRQGECVFCRAGWIWDYPSYDNAAFALLHSKSIDGDNIGRLNDPAVDAAIDEARTIVDDEARYERYQEAERLALADGALVPINWYRGNVVYDGDALADFEMTPLFFPTYETASLK